MLCPCDQKKAYQECCGIYHKGTNPENALALMRSRYSAYALHLAPYIVKTTHPQNPAFEKNFKKWTRKILEFCKKTRFTKLEIVEFQEQENIAFVTFIAHLEQNGKSIPMQEKSLFEKLNGIWYYKQAV